MQPGCDHLANTYDRAMLKGMSEQDLIEYALNRILALDRDNGNKSEGLAASRIYKSRNTRTGDILASKCHVRRGALQCMRNSGHPSDDRDQVGSHKF
jgi:hypothetical protein